MKAQKVEGEQQVQHESDIIETEHDSSIEPESELKAVKETERLTDSHSVDTTPIVTPEFSCAIALFIYQNFNFDVEEGKVVIPKHDLVGVEEALIKEKIFGTTEIKVKSKLMTSKEISIDE